MYKLKTLYKNYSAYLLVCCLVIICLINQAILYAGLKQSVTLVSFFIDLLYLIIIFLSVAQIPNITTRKIVTIFFFLIINLFFISDALYSSYYSSYYSIQNILEVKNVDGRAGDMGVRLNFTSLFQVFLLALGTAYTIIITFKKRVKNKKNSLKFALIFLLIVCTAVFNSTFFYQIKNKTYADENDYYTSETFLFDSIYSTKKFVEKYGYLTFRIKEIISQEKSMANSEIKAYFDNREEKDANSYTGTLAGYNVINILSETLDTRIVTYLDDVLKNNSNPNDDNLVEELVPAFYSMYHGTTEQPDSGSLIFDNYYVPKFSSGSTINSEFMSITSMYPYYNTYWSNNIGNHRANVNYEQLSLPAKLEDIGYDSYYMHANIGEFYDRTNLMKNMGFDNIYFCDTPEYIDDYGDIGWLYDENLMFFFDGINTDNLFYASVMTYSMHGGNNQYYTDSENKALNLFNALYQGIGDFSTASKRNLTSDEYIYSYLVKLMYYDAFLSSLLNWIDDNDIGKTLINIYPDHYNYMVDTEDPSGGLYKEYFGVNSKTNEVGHQCLVMYLTDGFSDFEDYDGNPTLHYDHLMSTIDLVPTILNLVSPSDNSFTYKYFFGNDVFDNPEDNFVYFSDLTVLYKGIFYNFDYKTTYLSSFYPTGIYPESLIREAKLKLIAVIKQLRINKSIINNDFYQWLKLQS